MLDAEFGVNYGTEFKNMGINPELENIVLSTGGRMFSATDYDAIVNQIKTKSKRTVTKKENIRWPFVISALLLFLLEIAIRKIAQNRRSRESKVHEVR